MSACNCAGNTLFRPSRREFVTVGALGFLGFSLADLLESESVRAEEKKDAPGLIVTSSLPALIRSGSTSASVGYGPMPRIPFSDCSTTSSAEGM